MAWLPKVRRIRAGHYIVECGEEKVTVKKSGMVWTTSAIHMLNINTYTTKREAIRAAVEYLEEYA